MKKKIIILLLAAMVLQTTACGKDSKQQAGTDTVTQAEDGSISVDGGVVILGDYKGVTISEITYEVTEENMEEEISSRLEEYVEYNEVDRAAKEGDYVGFDMKATENGNDIEDYTGEGYGTVVGDNDFGEEFDKQLTGSKKDDKLKFKITYDEDFMDTLLAGKTVDFEVTVTSVEEIVEPELTDAFVKEKMEYGSIDEFKQAVREDLEEANEENAHYEMKSSVIQKIIEDSEFVSYSDELYEECKASTEEDYMSYAQWFGCETVEEVYEVFGMTEESVQEDIMNQVYTKMVIDAVAYLENLELTDEDFEASKEDYAVMFGYETADELLAEYGEDEVRAAILQEQVVDFLYDHANIIESSAVSGDEEVK